MAQAVRVYLANQRRGTANTKGRGDVSGGGKKPWRQKGTGRARQGSTRSPIWTKGGVAHGPHPRDWSLKLSKNMRRQALFSALSARVNEENLLVLENLNLDGIKTKVLVEILKKLPLKGKTLLILPEKNNQIYLSGRNIDKFEIAIAKDLNPYLVLRSKSLLVLESSLSAIEKVFLSESLSKNQKIVEKEDRKDLGKKEEVGKESGNLKEEPGKEAKEGKTKSSDKIVQGKKKAEK